jgi:hypothetical protein
MVYERVFLIAGALITRQRAEELDYVDEDGFVHSHISGMVHSYPCCSELGKKMYIWGRIMHTFHRVRLDACSIKLDTGPEVVTMPTFEAETIVHEHGKVGGKYYACKTCLGTTNGGSPRWFDVEKILNSVVEYSPDQVCASCYDVEYVIGQPCRTCMNTYNCRPVYDLLDMYLPNDTKPIFYLMLDDCLSCL